MTDCQFCELEEDSILALEGNAIADFLQGQLTCDTRPASAAQSVAGALCNPQGRVVADLRLLLPEPGCGLLRLSAGLAEHTATVLGRYAMFSRISVTPARDRWVPWALWGAGAATLLAEVAGPVPDDENACTAGDGWIAVRCDSAGEAFELYLAPDRGAPVRDGLARAAHGDEAAWRTGELHRGLFRLGSGQQEAHLPQALNYDRAGLVSFHKGCYTGQEVIARLHYRGRAKKRWGLWEAGREAAPAPGDLLQNGEAQAVGEVLRVVASPGGLSSIAALTRVEALAQPLYTAGGASLQPVPLPYEDGADGG